MTNNNSTKSSTSDNSKGADSAANLIRKRIDALYSNEPDAIEELEETFSPHEDKLSKHQQYIQKITTSGLSLAEIQTAWHQYYVDLPDNEKHEVWKEFYAEHNKVNTDEAQATSSERESTTKSQSLTQSQMTKAPVVQTIQNSQDSIQSKHKPKKHKQPGSRTVTDVKDQLLTKARHQARGKLKAKQHFQSLLFGLSMGMIVVLVLLFGLFNDRFIAPFITPSKSVSATPIIIDSSTTAVDPEPKVIIPKINVEIPVVYDEPSVEEQAIQNALERGVVHYATTPLPGEKGNAVIFGHSSNNILNKGKYKFAFVLLNKLENGDIFYLNKDGIRYAYKIYEKKIVAPTDLSVLKSASRTATATLITCDPPGTSLNRLIVIGEQISPDPVKNKDSTASPSAQNIKVIPSNAPSLWQRIKNIFN
jgi:sortase A